MEAEAPQTPYQVYCAQCRVTFPAGSKRCLHCGGRLSRDRTPQSAALPIPMDVLEEIPEEEVSKRSSRISPVSVLWIVAAIGVALQRACSS